MKTTHLTLLLLWLGISSFINGEFYFPETEALQAVAFSSGSPVQPYVRQYGLSPKQCVVECALRKRCAAFTYKRQYQRCDLLPVLDNVEEWTTMEEGLVMGNMTENTRNVSFAVSDHVFNTQIVMTLMTDSR